MRASASHHSSAGAAGDAPAKARARAERAGRGGRGRQSGAAVSGAECSMLATVASAWIRRDRSQRSVNPNPEKLQLRTANRSRTSETPKPRNPNVLANMANKDFLSYNSAVFLHGAGGAELAHLEPAAQLRHAGDGVAAAALQALRAPPERRALPLGHARAEQAQLPPVPRERPASPRRRRRLRCLLRRRRPRPQRAAAQPLAGPPARQLRRRTNQSQETQVDSHDGPMKDSHD
eukprot:1183276-Prorocentrum_minimum.AAC.1